MYRPQIPAYIEHIDFVLHEVVIEAERGAPSTTTGSGVQTAFIGSPSPIIITEEVAKQAAKKTVENYVKSFLARRLVVAGTAVLFLIFLLYSNDLNSHPDTIEFHEKVRDYDYGPSNVPDYVEEPETAPEALPIPLDEMTAFDDDDDEYMTLYRGSSLYEALITVETQTFDIDRIKENQDNNPNINPQGVYFTESLADAQYWGTTHPKNNGYGIISITMKRTDWEKFKSMYPGVTERFVIKPHRPGMRETIVPFYSVNFLSSFGTPPLIQFSESEF